MRMHVKGFRVYLRAIEADDYLVSHRWRSDHELFRGTIGIPRFVSKETERKWVAKAIEENETGRALRLAICTKEDEKHIGYISLLGIDEHNRAGSVSLLIGDRNYQGKGLFGEAMYLLLRYAFDELGTNRVQARVLADNAQSIRAFEKFGYVKEGVLRQAAFRRGQHRDLIVYSMLRSEFVARYAEDEISGLCQDHQL